MPKRVRVLAGLPVSNSDRLLGGHPSKSRYSKDLLFLSYTVKRLFSSFMPFLFTKAGKQFRLANDNTYCKEIKIHN